MKVRERSAAPSVQSGQTLGSLPRGGVGGDGSLARGAGDTGARRKEGSARLRTVFLRFLGRSGRFKVGDSVHFKYWWEGARNRARERCRRRGRPACEEAAAGGWV